VTEMRKKETEEKTEEYLKQYQRQLVRSQELKAEFDRKKN